MAGHAQPRRRRHRGAEPCLTCPELIGIDSAGAEVPLIYRWLQATRAMPRLLVDTTMASLLALVRRGTGGQVTTLRL